MEVEEAARPPAPSSYYHSPPRTAPSRDPDPSLEGGPRVVGGKVVGSSGAVFSNLGGNGKGGNRRSGHWKGGRSGRS